MTTTARPVTNGMSTMLLAWLVAGTADIVVACTYYPLTVGVHVLPILQGIAAGVLGAGAFDGGVATALLGLGCHYLIALIWTMIFFAIYRREPLLSRHRIITAIAYGVLVSVVMTFVVLPLSRVAPRRFDPGFFAVATLILVCTIGAPLTWFASRRVSGCLPQPSPVSSRAQRLS
jgi:hypothetical protein